MKRLTLVKFLVALVSIGSFFGLNLFRVPSQVSAGRIGVVINYDGKVVVGKELVAVDGGVYKLVSDVIGTVQIKRSNCVFDGNGHSISLGEHGIICVDAANVVIRNAVVRDCYYGISIMYSCSILNCTVTKNRNGIVIGPYGMPNSVVSNNKIIENGDGIFVTLSGNLIENNVIANNTGRGIVLDGHDYHPANNRIRNNVITGNKQHGIEIVWTSPNTTVTQNLIAENALNGVTLYHTERQNLFNNTVVQNYGHGVYLEASNLNVVKANIIRNNTGAGLFLVGGSAANSVANNTLAKNRWLAIYLDSSSGNTIYHNFISENGKVEDRQAASLNSVNQWDNGYPAGGNFWSDYSGADMYQGPEQNQQGSDGIGDTPYVISVGEKDRYPILNAIVIQPDGTVSPSNAPIDQSGDVYRLKEDIRTRISVYRDHCVLDGNGHLVSDVPGAAICVEASEVAVTNFVITRCGVGISVSGKRNTVTANKITYCSEHGIVLTQTASNVVTSNDISFSDGNGILLDGAYNATVSSNRVASNLGNGVYIINSTETHVELNELLENRACGLSLVSSKENFIGRSIVQGLGPNTVSRNWLDGIYVEESEENTICRNTISRNGRSGLCLSGCNQNGIGENQVQDNTLDGIALYRSCNNVFGWNQVEGGGRHGLLLYQSDHNRFEWESIKLVDGDGVNIDASSYNHLELFFAFDCAGNGLVLQGGSASNVFVKLGIQAAGKQGILIHGSDENEFFGPIVNVSCGTGLVIMGGSSRNYISDGRILGSAGNGIFVDFSCHNRISHSTIANSSGVGVWLHASSHNYLTENIVENNTGDGIKLDRADDNTVENNNLKGNKCGVVLVSECSGNLLVSNKVTGNREFGFLFSDVSGNTLTKNHVATNLWQGIVLSSSSRNNVTSNIVESNGETGISLFEAGNNTVYLNIIAGHTGGGLVLSESSSGNAITNNSVRYSGYAIIVDSSSGNRIYHNDFLNNTVPAFSVSAKNSWDAGYPSGGNYWSQYEGVDVCCGKNQSMAGSDGLGDSPYVIDAENIDHYPLISFTGDVSITDLRIVQVVFDPPSIVAGKKAALYIEVFSSFVKNVPIEVKVTYGFGAQTYLEMGKDRNGVIVEPGINRIYVPGGPAYPNNTVAWLQPDDGVFLYWNVTGIDSSIKASLDPQNKIREMNERNNEMVISKKVVETKPLKVLVRPLYFPEAGQKPYVIATQGPARFLLETYPVSESTFEWVESQIVAMPGVPPEGDDYEDWLYNYIALPQSVGAKLAGYDRVVLVINNSGHNWAGLAIGTLRQPENLVPVFVDYGVFNATKGWMELGVVAHEIGHTFYLWHPHDIGPPVWRSICYCVSSRIYETEMNTFMSYVGPPNWIDPGRYCTDPRSLITLTGYQSTTRWNLLDQFKTAEDPEVIVISGILFRNQTVRSDYPWYYVKQGTVDSTLGQTGEYSIAMVDGQNQTLESFWFSASFEYLIDVNGSLIKSTTDAVPFVFNVPYLAGTSRIEIRNAAGAILASRVVSANSPRLRLVYPNGGETISVGSVCTIEWQGSDPDGDKLTYGVMYSKDDGETWIPIDLNIEGTGYSWDTTGLGKGTEYRIRILASDGINVAEDISDRSFSIFDQPPINLVALVIAFLSKKMRNGYRSISS